VSGESQVRTSLAVGFPEGGLPESLSRYRGRVSRDIPVLREFPFEDAQFEVVLLAGPAVSCETVREAHRVLRPEGRLYFIVPERTRKQVGFALPDIYSLVRDGFNIVGLERPPWWLFGLRGRTLSIVARKKAWKPYRGFDGRKLTTHALFAESV